MQNFINNQTVFNNNESTFRLAASERGSIFNVRKLTFTATDVFSSTDCDKINSEAGLRLAVKRAFDITVALTMLFILVPLLLLIALLIKLTSKGPVIFSQQRPGKDLQPFTMLKFRTMAASDEYEKEESLRMKDGSFCKTANDVRITPIGRFLRKCSIDELPQLINVLRGDMSLVGPRPILNCELETFNMAIQKRRFSKRPGLTCSWQVSGRSNTSNQKRLENDLEYINNWSLLLDLKLLLKTVPVVFKCQGAM